MPRRSAAAICSARNLECPFLSPKEPTSRPRSAAAPRSASTPSEYEIRWTLGGSHVTNLGRTRAGRQPFNVEHTPEIGVLLAICFLPLRRTVDCFGTELVGIDLVASMDRNQPTPVIACRA